MKFGLTQQTIDNIITVLAQFPNVDKALMFGSRAKGNFRPDSDMDIAIKGKKIAFDDILKMNVLLEDKGIELKVDLIDYDAIKEPALVEHIDRVGIEFYSRIKEYKLLDTPFGTIAEDWKYIPSLEFCYKITDGTHDSPKQQLQGKHLVTSKHIKGRNIDFETAYLISQKDYDSINLRSRVEQWDVIISMIGEYCGFTYVERNKNIDYAVKNVGLFKTVTEHKAMWLYYYLNSKIGRFILEINKSGTSQPYLTLGFLRELPILYPPSINEAEQIIQILSSLDDKIDLLHRQNKTLESLAETLFRQWFVEEAEESWEEKSLYDCIKLVGGGTPKTDNASYWNGEISWLSGGDIASNHKSFVTQSEKLISELGLKNSSAKLLPKYSTVISARGTVGKYCLLARPMTFSQSNYGIIPKYENCFFFTYLLVAQSVEELQAAAYGAVFDTITTTTFKEHKLFLPSKFLIERFEESIKPYFQKIESNQLQIRTLTRTRDTLLPKLMSGEVKVFEHN